ncbi:unnamed protein product [Acanthoscelides obtectus]|uniref:Kinesin motor domain-containing protein n=1 Tax=Acanthoscelides obtectus TaxID=200917 RepID=A0A9P0Q282_ACAOB|nr:unnamed protein product [Acanthoscelides obtectus]CAK1629224.1 Centromere-associated protein E [Acanthoscelides obtectus]
MTSDNINVAIKIRPMIQREVADGLERLWNVRENCIWEADESSRHGEVYIFDHIFNQECTNSDVYGSVVKPLVDSFMEGFNATIFAYGQTSSGKTHTILGTKTDPGLFQLVSNQIFQHVADQVDKRYLIRCSYIEIYNEKINDLLDKSNQGLTIREDIKGNVLLDAREAVVDNVDQVMENMMQGNKIRRVASTRMNERSSRSHTIFRIILESKDANQKDGPVHISYLNLVDLAGSERVSLTKAAGERLKEGANINKSLSVLGNVIRQRSEGKEFISYRDSKLTRLLSQAIGGNAKSLIIGNVTLAAEEETRSTLEFAKSAKTVRNKPKVNIFSAAEEALQGYQNMTRDLETRLKKQAIKLEEMEKSKRECLLEIERLKTEVSIVGRFQMGASASTPKKTLRRHTFGDYGNVTPKKESVGYMPLKNYPPKEESPGREMRPIQEETYEEALAEAESVIAEDVPASVLKRQLKELEESFNELREFTKLDNQLEILDLKKQLAEANSEIDRYSKELRQVTDEYSEEIERARKNSQKAQECIDLQYRLDYLEQNYKKTLKTYESEIEMLRTQLRNLGRSESPKISLEAQNIELKKKVADLEAMLDAEYEDMQDSLSKLLMLKDILTETFDDVQGAATQTDVTMSHIAELQDEIGFLKELESKLRNDIKSLMDESNQREVKHSFEISDIRCQTDSTIKDLQDQMAELIVKNDDEKKLQQLITSPKQAGTEPEPPVQEDVAFYREQVEFSQNMYRNMVIQMEGAMEKLKLDHQIDVNEHMKQEAELSDRLRKSEDLCSDYLECIRDLEKKSNCINHRSK